MRRLVVLALLLVALISGKGARADVPAHPDVPAASGETLKPTAPVTVSGRTFYGHGADLLEWNGSAIVARTRLPARIVAVTARDEKSLIATLEPKSEWGVLREHVPVVVAIDGVRPGRGFWSGGYGDGLVTLREARVVGRALDVEKTLHPARGFEAIAALLEREKIDRTNAFLPALRGLLLARLGQREEAKRAFDAAADLRGAPFGDLLRLSTLLEEEGATDAAQRAFDRGLAGLRAAGLRPERLQSQIAMQALLAVPRRALAVALAAGDVATVDRIAERQAAAFPRVEGGDVAWRALEAWMRARGREDLATKWRARADAAASSVPNGWLRGRAGLDRILPMIAGMTVVAPLVAFVVGMRRSARRGDSTRRIVVDLLAAVAPLIASMILLAVAAARITTTSRYGEMPTALLADAAASPDVERFIDARLVPSAERDVLLAYVRAEVSATRDGGKFEGDPPGDGVMRAAIDRVDWRASLARALRGGREVDGARPIGFQHAVIASGLLFLLGWWLGGRNPRAAIAASRAIPGGPESLGPIGAVLGGVFMGALFAFAGVDRAAIDLAPPDLPRWFGLESIASTAATPPSRSWAWTVGVVYALLHLGGVQIDRVRLRREG